MKDISSDPSPEPKKDRSGAAPRKKKQFIVIEIPSDKQEHSYPKAIFACDTIDEAQKLCQQMNSDAGYERYGVQRPASHTKK